LGLVTQQNPNKKSKDETMALTNTVENFFSGFGDKIIGKGQVFASPFGNKELIYADWTASGRAYQPIEECIQKKILPFVANTHTETSITGSFMSIAYKEARAIIKKHVHAGGDDILIFCGSGMTSAVNKLQRLLGLRIPEGLMEYMKKEDPAKKGIAYNDLSHIHDYLPVDEALRPVVFITHMEHHSNQLSWLETIATVEIIKCSENGNVDLEHFGQLLKKFRHRKNKIAAVTACSNVTGIQTPYYEIAKMIHAYDGRCFVDFACSAPYVNINMHPNEKGAHLDAIYFSPHKFLGGPGTPGILVFNKKIYKNKIPDQPGGGTILYSNPWKGRAYVKNTEEREDGGTPPFLQAIKAAMCIRLKEEMGVDNMLMREQEMLQVIFARFAKMKNVKVLEGHIRKRLGVVSFIVEGAHYDLIVKMLNDRFGIQVRGGCSCAGTYGHYLMQVNKTASRKILTQILSGNMLCKPGWIRLSIHPTMSNETIDFIMDAIEWTAAHFKDCINDYLYDAVSNEYSFKEMEPAKQDKVAAWFNARNW